MAVDSLQPPCPLISGAVSPPASTSDTMAGRSAALDALHAAWREAEAGTCQFVWLAGEAGVGKTTQIKRWLDELGDSVLRVRGQCVAQTGADEPYLPVLQALADLCRQDPSTLPLLREVAPSWLAQLPSLLDATERSALQNALNGSGQGRMLREFAALLDRCTVNRPLLLVIEDLEAADHATHRLMDHVARHCGNARLLWLASFRPVDIGGQDHPIDRLRHDVHAHAASRELTIEPFTEADVGRLLTLHWPATTPPETFIRQLHTHTRGVPLFVVNELDDLLAQCGGDASALFAARVTAFDWHVPPHLAGVIERRIARLPPELRMVLEAAALVGMAFDAQTVADALERDPAWVRDRLDDIARRGPWLHESPLPACDATSHAFSHASYRQAFEQRIAATTRVRWHRAIAESLVLRSEAGQPVSPAELAAHFEQARNPAAALQHAAAAVRSAIDRFAPLEAASLAERALALIPLLSATPERDALELAIVAPQGVALARLHGMAAPQAVAAFERTRVLCDALPINAERAWLMGRLGWVLFARGEYAATVALAARIHEWSLAHDDALLAACACCLTGVALSYQGQLQDAVRWMEQGLADCAGLEDRLAQAPFVVDPQVCMHGSLGRPLLLLGRTAEALVHAGAARTRAERIGQPMSELVARWCHGALEIALDRPEAVEEATAPLPALVECMASAPGEGPARWMRGWLEARHGDPDAGLADILEGLAHHKRYGMSAGCPQVLGYAADASFAAGDLPSALAQVDEGLALARRMDEGLSLPELTLQKAQLLQAGGRTVEACTLLRQTVDLAQRERAVRLELQALDALCATSRATPDELSALQRVRTIAAAIAAESAMA